MFKIFVFCSLLAAISCFPSDQQSVENVVVAVEDKETSQALPVSIEQVLKTSQTKEDEPVNETSLKVAEPSADVVPEATPATVGVTVGEENTQTAALKNDENDDPDKNRTILLLAVNKINKFTTTTTTTTTTSTTTTTTTTTTPAAAGG